MYTDGSATVTITLMQLTLLHVPLLTCDCSIAQRAPLLPMFLPMPHAHYSARA